MIKTLKLTKQDIYNGPLILVNRKHPITKAFSSDGNVLAPLSNVDEGVFLEPRVAVMLSQLIKSCKAETEILPVSGYRSYEEQKKLFDDSMKSNGEAFTNTFVALPNCSEHQTGLAVDVAENKAFIDDICPDFPYHGIFQQFREKAMQYGFIERYQKGKEHITGIGQEPWHFRYVGYPHSEIIQTLNLSLEEYSSMIKQYRYVDNPYIFKENKVTIEVSYIDFDTIDEQSIELTEGMVQTSGNNVDGVIVTVWRDEDEK